MTTTYYIAQLFFVLTTFLFGSIFTLLFLDIPFNKKNSMVFIIYSLLSILSQCISIISGSTNVIRVYPLFVHFPLLLLCILVYKKSPLASITSLLINYFLATPRYVIAILIGFAFPNIPYETYLTRSIATIPMVFLTWFVICKPIRLILKRNKKDMLLFLIPMILVYSLSYILYVYTDLLSKQPLLIAEIMVTLFLFIIIYYIHIFFVTYDSKQELELKNQMLYAETSSMQSQKRFIEEAYHDTRILKHDMRHFAMLIQEYAINGDVNKIVEYTASFTEIINKKMIQPYCKNTTINLILSAYLRPFNEHQCKVDVHANLPEDLMYSEIDVCMVLANALDNAWHACKSLTSPFITIDAYTMTDKLFLKVTNSYEGFIPFEDGVPVTKDSGHGFGTKSIIAIAEKYHGLADFQAKDGVFTVQLILHYF